MKFSIAPQRETLLSLMRKAGYAPEGQAQMTQAFKFWRSLTGRRFPRFHLYVVQEQEKIEFSLHLDQKAPSYQGARAHSGEYSGPLVEQERDRILSFVQGGPHS